MSVTIGMSDLLKNAIGQQKPIELPVGTPFDCLQNLIGRFPVLSKWLYDEPGKIRPHVWLLVNDERIYEDGFTEPLNDGDNLFIMVAILGG